MRKAVDHMSWRVIITDSESASGVAPVCSQAATNHLIEDVDGAPLPGIDELGVYDCCPGPHIECWSESEAKRMAHALNFVNAKVCS